jgi:hypothetical protein
LSVADVDSKELSEYIKSAIESTKKGTKDTGYNVHDTIDLEIAVINTPAVKGGMKIFIVNASGEYNKETVSRIKISLKKDKKIDGKVILGHS